MIFEVRPALKVRMSMRFAGPHLDITKSQDQAATRPMRVNTVARIQRDPTTGSLVDEDALCFCATASGTKCSAGLTDVPTISFIGMLSHSSKLPRVFPA